MPLINRVGGGGADVSSVTATAGKVWEGYTFVDADGEPQTGTIPVYNNTIHHTSDDGVKAEKFSVADDSDDGVCFTFKQAETRIYPENADHIAFVYKSDWDAAYGQTVAVGLTGEVDAYEITIPVERTGAPRYFAITAMAGTESFSNAGTYEIVSMQYNQASDDYAWAVVRNRGDKSFDTILINAVGDRKELEFSNIGKNLVITINTTIYSFVGNNSNVYKYSYIIVW